MRLRVNQKVKQLHIERCFELREKFNLSFSKIGEIMTIKPVTVYAAMKRFAERGVHNDMRAHNG